LISPRSRPQFNAGKYRRIKEKIYNLESFEVVKFSQERWHRGRTLTSPSQGQGFESLALGKTEQQKHSFEQ